MALSRTRYTTPSASGGPLASPLLGRRRTMSCGDILCGGSGSAPPPCRWQRRQAGQAGLWTFRLHAGSGWIACWSQRATSAHCHLQAFRCHKARPRTWASQHHQLTTNHPAGRPTSTDRNAQQAEGPTLLLTSVSSVRPSRPPSASVSLRLSRARPLAAALSVLPAARASSACGRQVWGGRCRTGFMRKRGGDPLKSNSGPLKTRTAPAWKRCTAQLL